MDNLWKPRTFWQLLKTSFGEFIKDNTASLGAALSYYMVFSLAPVLIIVMSIAGLVFGQEAVQGQLKEQMAGLLGATGAEQVDQMIKAAYQPGKGAVALVMATVLLVLGATSVFGQLRSSLNAIWNIKPQGTGGIMSYVRGRFLSFAMIVSVGFLMLVSLAAQAVLTAFTGRLDAMLPGVSVLFLKIFNTILSLALTTLLILMIYKFMSDAHVRWRSLWAGSLFTAILFALGKQAIGVYLGHSHMNDTYGAAGSIVLVLLWVYYSAQIIFFGAEFTQAYAAAQGTPIVSPAEQEKSGGQATVHRAPGRPVRVSA